MNAIALDPTVMAVVDATREMVSVDLERLPLEQALKVARPQFPASSPPGSEDMTIAGVGGVDLRLRLYFPGAQPVQCPVVLYLHGGGFVGGSIEMDDMRCIQLAGEAGCIVASLDYRLAPESPFPAAIEDALAAWNWITANAAAFGGDAQRCAIYGSSAGGHIAVGATLLARERGAQMPRFQLLCNPALDPFMGSQSYREFSDGPFMTSARMAWYWKQYTGGAAPEGHPLWAPLTVETAGLPPALVITAEYDVLRDEGEAYAAHLRAAGIEARAERFAGMIHGFMTLLPGHEASIKGLKLSATTLRNAFAQDDC